MHHCLRGMDAPDAKCHMEIKRRIVIGEETFSQTSERKTFPQTSERKTRQESEETDDKTNAMGCHAIWITYMGYEKRRYKKTGGLRTVNNIMEKKRKNQLD